MGFTDLTPYKLTLDFKNNQLKTLVITQYDKDARTILVTCTDNGAKKVINNTTTSAKVKWMKPDNNPVFNICPVNSDGTITINISEQMSLVEGEVTANLMLLEATTESVLHTMPFRVVVQKGVFSNNTITSTPEFQALTQTLTDVEVCTTVVNGHIANVSNPHNVTKSQVGLGNVTNDAQIPLVQKGSNNGVAELGSDGKVPSTQLPSYVDDVLEYDTLASFPITGESGKIYVTLDTNLTYRWTGSIYTEVSQSLALGETSSTAYRGDRGNTAYNHSQLTSGNPHGVNKTDVGLSNVDNISTSDAYNPLATYILGAYCINDNILYKCTTAIPVAEAWTIGHWTSTKVGTELTTVNTKLGTTDISTIGDGTVTGGISTLNSANNTVNTVTSTVGTVAGGYVVVGKVVTVDIGITLTSATTVSTNIIIGLPLAAYSYAALSGVVISSGSSNPIPFVISSYLRDFTSQPSGAALHYSGSYIKA